MIVTNARPRTADKLKKQLCDIFRKNGLVIEANANIKVINFLDVTFDLSRGSFSPYKKPNNVINYVHKKSNHPPTILKNIPANINRRLSSISSSKEIFDAAVPPYQEALDKAGYDYKLEFNEVEPNQQRNSRRKRKRDIIFFNPPFDLNVKTKLGKEFLKILDSSFPVGNPLHGKLNRHNVKISYRTMPNMMTQVSRHNARLRRGSEPEEVKPCPHTRTVPCPMPGSGECNKDNVIYQATVTSGDKIETYVGCTKNFADRYYKHRTDMTNPKYKTGTTLSIYVWKLKEEKKAFSIKWKIIDRGSPYNPFSKVCRLHAKESYYILYRRDMASLNKKSEIFHNCVHKYSGLLMKL